MFWISTSATKNYRKTQAKFDKKFILQEIFRNKFGNRWIKRKNFTVIKYFIAHLHWPPFSFAHNFAANSFLLQSIASSSVSSSWSPTSAINPGPIDEMICSSTRTEADFTRWTTNLIPTVLLGNCRIMKVIKLITSEMLAFTEEMVRFKSSRLEKSSMLLILGQ